MADEPLPQTPADAAPAGPANVDVPRSGLSFGRLVLLLIGGGTLTLVLGLTAVLFVWRAGHRRAIDDELARLRQAGKPVTPAELDASYVVDPGRPDATASWLAAFDAARDTAAGRAQAGLQNSLQLQDGRINLDVIDDGTLRAFVADQGAVYAAIERAAAAGPNVRYPVDYAEGYAVTIDHAQDVRNVVRWLEIRIVLALREGRTDDAIDDIERALAAGQTLAPEPSVVAQLVRLAVCGVTFARLGSLLSDWPLTDEQLDRLERLLRPLDFRSGFVASLDGERAMILALMDGGDFEGIPDDYGLLRAYGNTPLAVADQRFALEVFRQLEQAASREDTVDLLRETDVATEMMNGRFAEALIPPVLAGAIMPGGQTMGEVFVGGEAGRRLLIAGIGARRYRLRTGRLPATSDELASALPGGLPVDPYDGRPMRLLTVTDPGGPRRGGPSGHLYNPIGPGLALYCVGRNRVDDGGVYDHASGFDGDQMLYLPETIDPGRLFVSKATLDASATLEDAGDASDGSEPVDAK